MEHLPEPEYRRSLRATAAKLEGIGSRLEATLCLHGDDGQDYVVPLSSAWQPLPGRPGVQVFHIPDPSGAPGLYMTAFAVEEGSAYSGSRMDESRLLVLMEGLIECNGHAYKPGEVFWIGPNESTSWHAPLVCLGVVRYNVPSPDETNSL
ncbi:hypothetical protein [Hymenobacter tenuis]